MQQLICDSVDILAIAETKIDYSFPTAQFRLANYHTPYRLDISNKSGGILVYIKSNIPTRQLNCGNLCKSIQAVPFEINLRKEKWLVISIYRSPSQNSEFFLNTLTSIIDHFTKRFDNYIIMGDIANTFNEYFGSIVESLDLHVWTESSCNVPPSYTSDNDIDNILIKFTNHPSIKTIKQNFDITSSKFSFQPVSVNDVKQVIKDLKSNKSVGGDIPTNILKECNFTFSTLADCINKSFENKAFPDCLKEANVTPIFKKDDPLDKENYRSVSILTLLSKVFEKLIYKQL